METGIPVATLLAFMWASLLIELTPGPNMSFLAILSADRGWRPALAAVAGVAAGLALVGLAASLGLAALFERQRWLYEVVRWGGVAYLLWLAYETFVAADEAPPPLDHLTALRLFRDGLVTNLLNPKAVVFYVTILPAFTDAARPLGRQIAVLATVYVAIATVVHVAIVMLAARAAEFLTDRSATTALRRGLAITLALVALWLAWTTRRVVL